MTAQQHLGLGHWKDRNPVGQANLARHVASHGRRFPSPWRRRLRVIALVAVLGAAIGLASGAVL